MVVRFYKTIARLLLTSVTDSLNSEPEAVVDGFFVVACMTTDVKDN